MSKALQFFEGSNRKGWAHPAMKQNIRAQSTALNSGNILPEELARFNNYEAAQSENIKQGILDVVESQREKLSQRLQGKIDVCLSGSAGRNEAVPFSDLDITFFVPNKQILDNNSPEIVDWVRGVREELKQKFEPFFSVDVYDVFETVAITPELLEKRFKEGKMYVGINMFLPLMDLEFLDPKKQIKKEKLVNTLSQGIQKNPQAFLREWKNRVHVLTSRYTETGQELVDVKSSLYRIVYMYIGFLGFSLAIQNKEKEFRKFMMISGMDAKIQYLASLGILSEKDSSGLSEIHQMVVYLRSGLGFFKGDSTLVKQGLSKEQNQIFSNFVSRFESTILNMESFFE